MTWYVSLNSANFEVDWFHIRYKLNVITVWEGYYTRTFRFDVDDFSPGEVEDMQLCFH